MEWGPSIDTESASNHADLASQSKQHQQGVPPWEEERPSSSSKGATAQVAATQSGRAEYKPVGGDYQFPKVSNRVINPRDTQTK